MSDRLGRKRALMLFVTITSVASLLTAAAPDVTWLLMTRLMTGFGLAAGIATTVTYVAEIFPPKTRGSRQGLLMVIALCSAPITSWFARFTVPAGPNGWRWVFVWGAVGMVFLVFSPWLYESPRWQARQGRLAEADATLRRMEAEVARHTGPLPEARPLTHVLEPRAPWSAMFQGEYRRRTLALSAIWMLQTVGFFGFASWVPTLLVKQGITLEHSLTYAALISLGSPMGALLAAYVADRFERKFIIITVALAIALFGLLYGLTFIPALIVLFGLAVGLLLHAVAPLLYAYTPEQFPTDMRGSAAGFTYGLGRLANVANAFVIAAIFLRLGYAAVFVYIAGAWVLTAALVLAFGPRTTGRRLELVSPVAAVEFVVVRPAPPMDR